MSNLLSFKNVIKEYGRGTELNRVVDSVSFDVEPGEIVSVIGESGSGKTTIGKMLLKLEDVTQGQITFQDKDINEYKTYNDLKDYYKKVQAVFQDPFSSFNPIFKVDRIFKMMKQEFFENSKQGNIEFEKKLDSAISSVGFSTDTIMGKYPHQFSGGQLQRILIARALMLDCKVLVADEIISMLDASIRIDVLNLLADLSKQRDLSVMFITHDLSLGYYISKKVVILYKGCLVEYGDPHKVFFNPVHTYTQNLLFSVPRLDRKWDETKTYKKHSLTDASYIPKLSKGKQKMVLVEQDHYVNIED